MCWQTISLKDPSSQELLDAVEHKRNVRMNPPRNTTIFHHPTLGDFELQHLVVVAAMGRGRQIARREGQRNKSSSTQGRQHFLVFPTHPNGASAASATPSNGCFPAPTVMVVGPDSPLVTVAEDASQLTSPGSQDRAGPLDLQSFSENLKTPLSSLSTRYKELITKSTRGWKERIFARNISITETTPNTKTSRESSPSIKLALVPFVGKFFADWIRSERLFNVCFGG
ncbi:E3 ubiquitin-protein ligase rhf2a [Phtheirospermum japonicum]|uniref:E3 ubiquitin-protein ligase rhf2a n=1 Tax=Phtheirospermum japonicum TaxID=374723 RepID=A0A830DB71_9LAMI|nr:E3 ubiquitin-protein ligase rhf2a [Phtheirospermum japonicum]